MSDSNLQDKGWSSMQTLLDQEMPVQKDRPGVVLLWVLILALLTLGSLAIWMPSDEVANQHAESKLQKVAQASAVYVEKVSEQSLKNLRAKLETSRIISDFKLDESVWTESGLAWENLVYDNGSVSSYDESRYTFENAPTLSNKVNKVLFTQDLNLSPFINDFFGSTHVIEPASSYKLVPRVSLETSSDIRSTVSGNLLAGIEYPLSGNWYLATEAGIEFMHIGNQHFAKSTDAGNEFSSIESNLSFDEDLLVGNEVVQDFTIDQLSVELRQYLGRRWNSKWSTELFVSLGHALMSEPSNDLLIKVPQQVMMNRIEYEENRVPKDILRDLIPRSYYGLGARVNYSITPNWGTHFAITGQKVVGQDEFEIAKVRNIRYHIGLQWKFN